MGFVHLQGLEQHFVERFLTEREARGPFASLEDFMGRVPFTLEQLVLLIRGGAFDFMKKTKAELLWQAHLNKSDGKKEQPETLFQMENQHFEFPISALMLCRTLTTRLNYMVFPSLCRGSTC